MHKGLLIPGVALLLAGCAASQTEAPPVRVDDLSTERAATTPAEYTVKSGDTLYGIAWRHSMDYRDLAEINGISPPYNIQPGQRLALNGSGEASGAPAENTVAESTSGTSTSSGGAVASGVAVAGGLSTEADSATSAASSSASGSDESLDWLLPGGSGTTTASNDASGSDTDSDAPGPVYEEDSDAASSEEASAGDEETSGEADASDESSDDAALAEQDADADSSASTDETSASSDVAETSDDSSSSSASSDTAESSGGTQQASADRQYTPVDPVPWQWPTSGSVVGQYGEGDSITAGIDISGSKGQPVKAAGPGIVVYAGSGVRGYGNLILLKHNDQYLSAYAHNDSLQVKENDVVRAGEVIATMGNSDAEDVRLHFEVRKDGQPQDPMKYLPAR